MRDNEFSQPRAATDRASDFGMLLQDQHGTAYYFEVCARCRGIALQVEFKDALQVRERLGREDDHADYPDQADQADQAMVRAFGRAAFAPLARSRK